MIACAKARHALRIAVAGTFLASVGLLSPDEGLAQEPAQVCTDGASTIDKTDSPDPVAAGANITYTITVTPATAASNGGVADTMDADTTFVSGTSPPGWTCFPPAVGSTGTVSCANAGAFTGPQVFTLTVNVVLAATGPLVNQFDATFVNALGATVNCGSPPQTRATETTQLLAVPALTTTAAVVLMAMLLGTGVWLTRRRRRLHMS